MSIASLFCKHQWIIHEKRIPSLAEEAQAIGERLTQLNEQALRVQHSTLFVCKKCGAIKIKVLTSGGC